ncbi:MAG: hypothetical protein JWL59_3412 [Chthoniobacteraceae bacterium]|nr:hypothetical protein [Chthoniobacteraceae bacterium]
MIRSGTLILGGRPRVFLTRASAPLFIHPEPNCLNAVLKLPGAKTLGLDAEAIPMLIS